MKYFVVGMHCTGKQELVKLLLAKNIVCGKIFTNIEKNNIRYEIFEDKDIIEIFENKAYIYMKEADEYTRNAYEGISLYEFDNNNVFVLSPDQFVAIPKQNLLNEDICLIWLDDNVSTRKQRYNYEKQIYDFSEQEEFERRDLDEFVKTIYSNQKFHILYFTNEDIARVSTILYACIKYPELVYDFEKTFK